MLVGKNIGPFVIEKQIGSGAMGTVYRARYTENDQVYALKILAFGLSGNDTSMARFERESQILLQLRHPNIVGHFARGKFHGTRYFAMEFINGESMDKSLLRRGKLSWENVVAVGKQLCGALQHAHQKGIIHRDLKPSNVMIDEEGVVKLTDFGIAKDVDVTALTGANNTIGTASYMSPEQCRGEKNLSGKSDLYSLGIVFYELLTGQKPFIAESTVDVFMMHVNSPIPRVSVREPGVPVWLDTLIAQLMEKRPEKRPRDAETVLKALEEIEQKVADQRSAGLDVAHGKGTKQIEQKDREAARRMMAGERKRRLRKKKLPFYRHLWFVALACLGFLGAMSGALYLLTRPPSAEEMVQQIEGLKDPIRKREAIERYLKVYGSKADERTASVRRMYHDAEVQEREKVLMNRYRIPALKQKHVEEWPEPEAYTKSMNALGAEADGDIQAARRIWKELAEKYEADGDEKKAVWGWLASKKLADLEETDHRIIKLRELLEKTELGDRDLQTSDEVDRRVLEALRLMDFNDPSRSRERWLRIHDDYIADPEKRGWVIFAARKMKELEPDKAKPSSQDRKKMVNDLLDRAKKELSNTDELVVRRDGRNHCRLIRDLYSEDPDLKAEVERAKEYLKGSPPEVH